MVAFLSWVDYSSAKRQRMPQAVALFAERDMRDELGVGSIRDAISNTLSSWHLRHPNSPPLRRPHPVDVPEAGAEQARACR